MGPIPFPKLPKAVSDHPSRDGRESSLGTAPVSLAFIDLAKPSLETWSLITWFSAEMLDSDIPRYFQGFELDIFFFSTQLGKTWRAFLNRGSLNLSFHQRLEAF